ncbi:unnamed protein product [Periconia digitata]|uniref:Clr5 domain-containing protein n=1 Tax=Periconia digitata TaxID=1303443 RepID=A0A9W4ULI5_9PLEO|nr:unnamed protein product [Periconia digitata]
MDKNTARAPGHPSHVWETQRHHFTRLYTDEKKKLVEVQRIMQDEYGFYATERQYKRKIKAWGLEKNSKATEKANALVRLKETEANLDLAHVYKFRGKDIAAHKLLRYAKSHDLEPPNIVRKRLTWQRKATKARPQAVTTSLAFATHTENQDPVFVNLHELFASFICFMWFEDWDCIQSLSRSPSRWSLSYPTTGFLKWASTILSVTRLGTNHVVLAMLYVYRLKSINRTVVGKAGSEYRLALIALMLANKYLDDNCYTNKTWAEVSGIVNPEICIMEVEFLSNMRYSLAVTLQDWDFWLERLGQSQEFLLRKPTEELRIVELPDIPQNDQQTVPSAVMDTEMHDISDHESPTDSGNQISKTHITPDTEMSDLSDAPLNDVSNPKVHAIADPNIQGIPNHEFDMSGNLHPDTSNDSIESEPVMSLNPAAFELIDTSFTSMIPSPLFPSTLTMELPTPTLNPDDALLEWRAIDSLELQEGPIPDLDEFLDPSMWIEDTLEVSQLEWNSLPLLEQLGAEEERSKCKEQGSIEEL